MRDTEQPCPKSGPTSQKPPCRQNQSSKPYPPRPPKDRSEKSGLVRIESASQKLGQAQRDAEGYLAGISEVIAGAHSEFAAGLKNVLGDGYREFYDRLSNATGLLRQAIEELASTVEPTMKRA